MDQETSNTISQSFVQEKLATLEQQGFVCLKELCLSNQLLQETKRIVDQLLSNEVQSKPGYNHRKFYHIPNDKIQSSLLSNLFTEELVSLLQGYLDSPVYQCCSLVVVPAHAPKQRVHKDHSSGPHLVLCLALSFDPQNTPIQTYFRPQSHLQLKCTDGSMDQMVQLTNSPLVLYDPAIDHCGASNPTDQIDQSRLFLSFYSGALGNKERGRLKSQNVMFKDEPIYL